MNKTIIFLVLASFGMVAALYSLPKIIVNNKKNTEIVNSKKSNDLEKKSTSENVPHEDEEDHSNKISEAQLKEIQKLKTAFLNSKSDKINTGKALVSEFSKIQRYDSAAFYSEIISRDYPTEKEWLATADLYYQAFTYAIDDVKGLKMGEKAREYYQKALDKNSNLLLAKTNMAMTFVSTPTPMKGILLLREVVAENPDFEPAVFNLGLLSMRSNQFSKAAERFKHLVNNNPKNTKAAFYLGVSLVRLGRNQEAKDILLKVKSADSDPMIQSEISQLLSQLN
jgi:tetratricopeptide (TPR) repeat protein